MYLKTGDKLTLLKTPTKVGVNDPTAVGTVSVDHLHVSGRAARI
jgi:hypothetical protein